MVPTWFNINGSYKTVKYFNDYFIRENSKNDLAS